MGYALARLENIEDTLEMEQGENPPFVINGHCVKFADGVEYKPHPTLEAFHADDSPIRLIMGAYRSGKSVGCCIEIMIRACAMPKCLDGVRRCKVGIVRNTYDRLSTTTVKTWEQWFKGKKIGLIGSRSKPSIQREYRFNDGDGVVELELLFIALDNPNDIEKLASLEVTFMYINEFRQIPYMMLSHFYARTGCYPRKVDCPTPFWRGVFLDTNPPNARHKIRQDFEVVIPEGYKMFKQPPALLKDQDGKWIMNPAAENVENLPKNYYLAMVPGATEEYLKVHACNQYGTTYEGQKVFGVYNDNLHAVDSIEFVKDHPLLLAFDFGRVCPACLLLQFVDGQLRAIKEFIGSFMAVGKLYEQAIKPYLAVHCKDMCLEAVGDPANTGEGRQQLAELGLDCAPARTNEIDVRLAAVEGFLSGLLIDGSPRYILSRQGCPILHEGFLGAYHYKPLQVVGSDNYKDKPEKLPPHADAHDCNQYGALHFTLNDGQSEIDTDEFSEANLSTGWN